MRQYHRLGWVVFGLALLAPRATAQQLAPTPAPPAAAPAQVAAPVTTSQLLDPGYIESLGAAPDRKPFESDHAFDGFIGPITNAILAKDPRSLTEARALFIENSIPSSNPLGPGDFQAYAMQVRVALSERLTLIADSDGYAVVHPHNGPTQDGWLNLGAGLKYVFWRDVENQTIASGGLMYTAPTGGANAFSGRAFGDGLFSFFLSGGKEFADQRTHLLANIGYQVPVNETTNSSFYYTSLHLDRQYFCKFYPLVELNWYHYVQSGNHGIPNAVGEGDGLLNLGTSGVAGSDLVTFALGGKYRFTNRTELGAAWEFPISNQNYLINNRLTVDFIVRY